MANSDLPQEILLEIFSRLPAKSVGKCRTLSKSWKTNLSTPNFIKKHLINRKQTIQQQNVALTLKKTKEVYIVSSPTEKDQVLLTEIFKARWKIVVGNGLVLLFGSQGLMLMNPITRKMLDPGTPDIKEMGYRSCFVFGFGYDSCSDDYKIVHIYFSNPLLGNIFVDVYSVKSGVWKSLDDGCYPYREFVLKGSAFEGRFEGGAFVNGGLHWLICRRDGYRSRIVVFDLAKEVFGEIALPKGFVREIDYDVSGSIRLRRGSGASVVGGCLLIVDNLGHGATDVWMLKEYGVDESWVKFRIHREGGDYKWATIVATLCYTEDGELLCVTCRGVLVACDLNRGTTRRVVLDGCDARFISGMPFADTLVSPEGSS